MQCNQKLIIPNSIITYFNSFTNIDVKQCKYIRKNTAELSLRLSTTGKITPCRVSILVPASVQKKKK